MKSLVLKFIGEDTWSNIRKLFLFLKMSKVNLWSFSLSIFFSVGFTLSAMYSVSLLFPLIDGIISNNFDHVRQLIGIRFIVNHSFGLFQSSSGLFILFILWIYLITIIRNIFHYLLLFSTQVQAKEATVKLRQLLIEKCLSYGKNFYDHHTIAFLQSVLTKSAATFEAQFTIFQDLTSQCMLLTVYFVVMMGISWKLTLIALIVFPAVTALTQTITRKIRGVVFEQYRLEANLFEKIHNMLSCMSLIKIFVKEKDEIKNFLKESEKEVEQSTKILRLTCLAAPIEDIGTISAILLVALGLAVLIRVDVALAPSKAIMFFYLAMRLAPSFNTFYRFRLAAANTAVTFLDIERVLNYKEPAPVLGGHIEFIGLKQDIKFNDLSFQYHEKDHQVLDKVSFSIERGSIVAIVGPSGSGKSTLIHLLLRFYDCPSGSILVDGRDIKEYDVATLRKHMVLVSQETVLFNDSVRNNITYGHREPISDEFLQEFGANVQIKEFVDKLPHKFESLVGENGTRLSGGEKQRLSLARAIIRSPEVLIMDESTNALDSKTEELVMEYVLNEAKGKTLIIVAHRLSTIKKADKIIYLDKGRVTEVGAFDELINTDGMFSKQWELQRF